MKISFLLVVLGLAVAAGGQVAPENPPLTPDTTAAGMAMNDQLDALKLRRDLVADIVRGGQSITAAVEQLKRHPSPTGLKVDHDADFALAAVDVGQRLLVARKPAEAETFFLEAEKSFQIAIEKQPEISAREKAQWLSSRSFLRGHYLSKIREAKQDIERAIALQPEDWDLQRARENLARSHAEYFKPEPKR